MKKMAFFIAVLVGLNATSVGRRPEEEEGQTIAQHENHPSSSRRYASIIQLLTDTFNLYFYAITKEGIFHRINWERIDEIINKQQKQGKITRIVFDLHHGTNTEYSNIQILK